MYANYMISRGKSFISTCSLNSTETTTKREKNPHRYRGIHKRTAIMKIL